MEDWEAGARNPNQEPGLDARQLAPLLTALHAPNTTTQGYHSTTLVAILCLSAK